MTVGYIKLILYFFVDCLIVYLLFFFLVEFLGTHPIGMLQDIVVHLS